MDGLSATASLITLITAVFQVANGIDHLINIKDEGRQVLELEKNVSRELSLQNLELL